MEEPRPPVPVQHQLLCYDSRAKIAEPESWLVRPPDLSKFLLEVGPKGVLVTSWSGFELLRSALGSDLLFVGDQRVTRTGGKPKTTCLAQTFLPVLGVPSAGVIGMYGSPGRADQGIRAYVPHRPKEFVRIVAVEDHIFRKLRRRAVATDPDREILRAIRSEFAGASDEVERVCREIILLAPGDHTVVVLGETGTGKEVVAQLLHRFSGRKGPIVATSCATIPEGIAEAELFGTVLGAAMGATNRPGVFEAANGGTVFLDEIGELPPVIQAKLLRVLETREVVRLGTTKAIRVDFKLVVATYRDLAAMVARGQFREDLYQRLMVSVIETPVLREHREDIEFHIQRMWRQWTGGETFPKDLLRLLVKRDWTGNVRQLRNCLEGLHRRTTAKPLTRALFDEHLRRFFRDEPDPEPSPPTKPRPVPPGPDGALKAAIRSYEAARPAYRDLEQVTRSLVDRLVAELSPLAVVRSRTKTVTSFAERMQRHWTDNVFRDVRDLSGVRVIVQTEEHKLALLHALEQFVEVEHGPHAPGHDPDRDAERAPSVCWLRIPKRGVKNLEERLGMAVPTECAGHWCELQLRTTTEDAIAAWREAVIGRLDAPPPESWTKSLAEVEEVLARAQGVFERIRRCASSYGGHLSRDDMRRELEILERTLRCAPRDPTIAARAGKLALNLGDFERARTIMAPHEQSQYGPLLRDLGVAICQTHDPSSERYREGIELLERACKASPRDPETFAALAGVYLRTGDLERALACHREALRIDDSYPYAVSGLLQLELRKAPSSDLLAAHRAMLKRAVVRCREEIEAAVGIPFGHLNLGKFLVLLGNTKEGLAAYVDAIRAATAPFMFQTSIESLASLLEAECIPAELDLARRMLQIGLCARYPAAAAARECAASLTRIGHDLRSGPVVLVVGRGGEPSASVLAALGEVLGEALSGFAGTVASIGDHDRATAAVRDALAQLPRGAHVERYRKVEVAAYWTTAKEPLPEDLLYPTMAAWADVIAAGVRPSSVLLLAMGSESRTAPDRNLARALGAKVAVLDVDRAVGANSTGEELVIRDAIALREVLESLRAH